MYCYAVNGRSANPAHLWLTGCSGEMATHLQRIPGYDKWIIEKAAKPYIEAFEDRKENLVYLTADAETVLDDLDMSKIYIIGGLVDRNRWKGITLKKSAEQGIQSAKLPIGNYLKMSSSQVSVYLFLPFTWKKIYSTFNNLVSESIIFCFKFVSVPILCL
jgi:tRNA (guanine9-N1)-methyltransferase